MPAQMETIDFERIKCRELVLCASDGEPRIFMSVDEDGTASIHVLDLAGRARISIATSKFNSAFIAFTDARDAIRLWIGCDGRGVELSMFDASRIRQGGWAVLDVLMDDAQRNPQAWHDHFPPAANSSGGE